MTTIMTLSSRRSGTGTGGGTCGVREAAPRATPQSPQNLLSAGFSPPHELQSHGRAVPQSPQNLLPVATSAPQRGHIIRPASHGSTACESLCASIFPAPPGSVTRRRGARRFGSLQSMTGLPVTCCHGHHSGGYEPAAPMHRHLCPQCFPSYGLYL